MKRIIIVCLVLVLTLISCKPISNETSLKNELNKDKQVVSSDKQIDEELPSTYKPMVVKNYSVSDNLKKISFKLMETQGIPAIFLKEPSEYKTKNPWLSNKDIRVLPVFKNKDYNLKYHEGPVEYLNEEEAVEVSLIVAEKIGIDSTYYECENLGSSYIIYFPNKLEPVVTIEPSIDEIRLFFDLENNEKISLPNIEEEKEDLLHEKYLKYYYDLFESILKMEQPIFECAFERDIYGDKMYTYKIFNQEDTVEDTIVNYNTDYVWMYINTDKTNSENNGLRIINITYSQLMKVLDASEYEDTVIEKLAKRNELEVVGYYPLISEEEALEKVLRKEYISAIEYDRDIELSDIMSIELTYYWVPVNEEILPAYEVYLDLRDTRYYDFNDDYDLKLYGLFFVPAIESKYLEIIESNKEDY